MVLKSLNSCSWEKYLFAVTGDVDDTRSWNEKKENFDSRRIYMVNVTWHSHVIRSRDDRKYCHVSISEGRCQSDPTTLNQWYKFARHAFHAQIIANGCRTLLAGITFKNCFVVLHVRQRPVLQRRHQYGLRSKWHFLQRQRLKPQNCVMLYHRLWSN